MANTSRTQADLLSQFIDNNQGLITAQTLRDFVVSVLNTTDNPVTAFAKTLLDDTDAATARTTLGTAATSHTHAAADIVSGTIDQARLSDIRVIGITIDGGGLEITTGTKGYINVPYAGTILSATLIADVTGSIVVDVYKLAFSTTTLPTASITASAKPTISSAKGSQNSTLTGWTTTFSANDTFGFNVDYCSTITKATLELKVLRS